MPTSTSRLAPALLSAFVILGLSGCATDSPPEQSVRLQKAAGMTAFQIETTKSLWETTTATHNVTDPEIKGKVTPLDNGLQKVELDGVTLANYLRRLDYDAHGGAGEYPWSRERRPESIRMYDEIAKVIYGMKEEPAPGDPPPLVIVGDAVIDTK
ncbi:hypothetical protein ACIP98_38185 [Streptomyces sp. NPDC088354]|uniref:hypothetical protein n=1 Tax=Streptomyces sp. NPDC088354 TaxID=3365856 RepID=UPI00381C957A